MLFLFFLWLLLSLFMYSLPPVDSMASKTILRFMSLETGGAHPLATEPDIQLDTELSMNLLDVRADVIRDNIVVALVDLRIHHLESDAIYLVDWKRGQMTLVVPRVCSAAWTHRRPCLELCRVTTSPRGTGNTNGHDAPSVRLRVVLALPIFHPDYRVHTAYMQTDDYCPRQRDPEIQVLQQQ